MKEKLRRVKNSLLDFETRLEVYIIKKKYVSGITVIELVLILVILIALLVIFKEKLINLLNTIFKKITTESSGI